MSDTRHINNRRPTDAEMMEAAISEFGYLYQKPLKDGRIAALCQFVYTCAIITMTPNGYRMGYEDRWCYRSLADAYTALSVWDGTGEPEGWHRHPDSGRRIGEDGKTYVRM